LTGTRGAAVVTGGAGGLGQAFVTALTAAGYAVVPVDLHGTERRVDVTDADACRTLADDVRPEVWVNNAGVSWHGDALVMTDAEVERLVAVNLLGVIHGSRAAAAVMRRRGKGVILNVASLAGWVPTPHFAIYSPTKHGVRAFSVALAAELCDSPVRVQCLLPDGIDTPMVDPHDERQLMSFTGRHLLAPEDVAIAGMALMRSRSRRRVGPASPRHRRAPARCGPAPGAEAPAPCRTPGRTPPPARGRSRPPIATSPPLMP
jgi:short-subunit dehydrogenase